MSVGALGGFGSFLLAGGAIYYAWKSARQADRSAAAAEAAADSAKVTAEATQEAVSMQRDEHKLLMRRPKILPVLELVQDRLEESIPGPRTRRARRLRRS